MNKRIATLLLIAAGSLATSAAYSQDAPSGTARLDLRQPDLRSIQVQLPQVATFATDADEMQDVAIVSAPSTPDESSNTHLSRSGIGSIYWAARHPAQAWRMLLPIVPGDGSAAFEDIRVECVTFVRSPAGQVACP